MNKADSAQSQAGAKPWTVLICALVLGLSGALLAAQEVTWSRAASMPSPNSEFGATTIGSLIYVVGGFLEENAHTLLIYDPVADSWSRAADIPIGVHHSGVSSVGGKVYVMAGGGLASSTVQIYDPSLDEWSQGAPMPTSRTAVAVAVLDGKIHVMGGSRNIASGRAFDVHEVYDPATDSWETRAPMVAASEHVFARAIGGKIYLVGGRNALLNLSLTQIYDPATDSWSTGSNMMGTASGMAVEVVDGKLYLYGGEDIGGGTNGGADAEDLLMRYDPVTDRWEELPKGPERVHGLASAVFGNEIYFFGGSRIVASGVGIDATLRLTVEGVGGGGGDGSVAAPERLKARARGRKKARLRWKDRSDNEVGFEIEMSREGGAFERVATLGANARRVTIRGLERGTTYTFRVRALGDGVVSGYSNEATVTTRS